MKKVTMTMVVLGLSALLLGATGRATMALEQDGTKRQRRNADRDQAPLAGRLAKGTVQGFSFGSNETATITVKTEEGETLVLNWINAKFHNDNAEASPSTFALKNPTGSAIAILYAQGQGKVSLREAWDLVSWNTELNRHKGIQTGGVGQLTNRVILLTNHRYTLSKDTLWVKAGKSATRDDFGTRQTVYVKGDTTSGVPVALVVADTEAGANMTALELAAPGGDLKPRPAPKGNTRPPSTGSGTTAATAYTIRVFLKITDSADNAVTSGVAGAIGKAVGVGDEKVECYGELRANGQKVWEILRKDAQRNQKRTGETITILPSEASGMRNGSSWRVTSASLALTGSLTDDDDLTNNDLLYSWNLNLNLAELANQGEKIYKSNGSKAELHVVVTK